MVWLLYNIHSVRLTDLNKPGNDTGPANRCMFLYHKILIFNIIYIINHFCAIIKKMIITYSLNTHTKVQYKLYILLL